jgi:hypothetical protein
MNTIAFTPDPENMSTRTNVVKSHSCYIVANAKTPSLRQKTTKLINVAANMFLSLLLILLT